jgi:hypothetical protein
MTERIPNHQVVEEARAVHLKRRKRRERRDRRERPEELLKNVKRLLPPDPAEKMTSSVGAKSL